ncbi:class I SAM-dependent methyltransferase [Paraflavitalea speifideaquila]|uniref:class I SAM-dependent methyltransferase n=1 Tax=Paraflavitalea speifideaquila TaxID=3076558 RepID=UPI0028E5609F|nr:class I SAM-dependent methyltransferase [Paraflavitalea speifideiaquila]
MNLPERISWALSRLAIEPTHQVMEIGYGAGAAIPPIMAVLTSGSLTAVERSTSMAQKAANRYQPWIKNRQLTLCTGEFSEVQLPHSHYNIIFAFNVNLFLAKANIELGIIRQCLAPGGTFYLFFQPPPTTGMEK